MANLARLRMIENLSGFLAVDKPAGLPFAEVVKAVKRHFNLVKLGHGGSLETMASGLLVLVVGEANKFAADLMAADRAWEGTMELGLATNTHDVWGERCGGSPEAIPLKELPDRIASVLPDFKGDIFQTESRHAAICRVPSMGYEIVDTGEHRPFMAHVYRLDVEPSPASPAELRFSAKVSSRVIARTLVDGFGRALGCGAALKTLRRTALGRFSLADAVGYEDLLACGSEDFAPKVLPVTKAFQ